MTVLVLFYLLYYKKLFIDDQEINYTLEEFFKLSQWRKKNNEEKKIENTQQSIF